MWITGKGNILIIIGVYFVLFSRWKALELYLLLWFCMWGRKVVSLMNWTSFFGPHYGQAPSPTCLLCLRRGDLCANNPAYSTHISSGTMGHGPFHCITPLLTSGAHGLPTFIEVSPTFGCHSPAQPLKTNIKLILLIESHYQYCVYVCLCTEGYSWSTMAGLAYVFVLNGAILNLIFK